MTYLSRSDYLKRSMTDINKILFITLSNIGDVILTLPVMDYLRENSPNAKITVLTSERAKDIFLNSPFINKVIVYDKRMGLRNNLRLFNQLNKEHFDTVVDLRNSLFGAFLSAKYKTSLFTAMPKSIRHMKDKHLYRLLDPKHKFQSKNKVKSLYISPQDEGYIKNILRENDIGENDTIIAVAAGARSHIKKWPQEKFAQLLDKLQEEFQSKIILLGDNDDLASNRYISEHSKARLVDLTAKTSITQLACLLKKVKLLITNDSAILHLASYLNVPIAAVFGPTNEIKYGPWSENSIAIKKEILCRPCENAQCRFGHLKCMQLISVDDVSRAVKNMLSGSLAPCALRPQQEFERILIARTDRIGDVLLSTPVIKALRDNYPSAYIAMMVSPQANDIIEGNPYLDEVIIYDKEAKHKSLGNSIRFARNLKKKKFDLAIILHPTNRVHLISFFAGIKRRVGFGRKLAFLLTDRIKHLKQEGKKHELEYNMDFLKYLGFTIKDSSMFMPIKQESEVWVDDLFQKEGIIKQDRLLAIHPAASCPSKIWPESSFAQVADRLIEKYNFKALIIAGPKDISKAERISKGMHRPLINLAGKTSVSQLASVLKRCSLFISNDSGPVHIASALGTPVISIFGRAQKGLSPKRWGPVGKKGRYLHKNVGCIECLAHNCVKNFACLKAITVEDVVSAADSILEGHPVSQS